MVESVKKTGKGKPKPIEVKKGNTRLPIYSGTIEKEGKTYPLFTVSYYEGGQRKRKTFGDLEKAKTEAGKIAALLEQGRTDVLRLSNFDQESYSIARRELAPTGVPLLDAVRQYVEAIKALPPDASLLAAVTEYARRHDSNAPRKSVPEVVTEFFKSKEQYGASAVYRRTLRYHLNPLSERFHTFISLVTTADLEDWLRGRGHTPRTRKNGAVSLTTLFRLPGRPNAECRADGP